jgi:arylsulfatase A-like enzyme
MGLNKVLFPNSKVGMPDTEITLAQALKDSGYATGMVGKWHLGDRPEHLPTRHGFEKFFGVPYSNDMKPFPLLRGEEVVERAPPLDTLTPRYTAEALEWIKDWKAKGRPYFLYVAHTFPHIPLAASEKFRGKSRGGLYGDAVEEIDGSVGELVGALDKNTLVIFTSDNGPWLEKKDLAGTTGSLRGGKFTPYEGGIRMPAIFWWPGKIAPRVDARPAVTLDLFPTLVALAGGTLPGDRTYDGRDIGDFLTGKGAYEEREFLIYHDGQLMGIISGRWKYLMKGELYDVDADPAEKENRNEPDVIQKLAARANELDQR